MKLIPYYMIDIICKRGHSKSTFVEARGGEGSLKSEEKRTGDS